MLTVSQSPVESFFAIAQIGAQYDVERLKTFIRFDLQFFQNLKCSQLAVFGHFGVSVGFVSQLRQYNFDAIAHKGLWYGAETL